MRAASPLPSSPPSSRRMLLCAPRETIDTPADAESEPSYLADTPLPFPSARELV